MLIRQTKDRFIRRNGHQGDITNQMTNQIYETGVSRKSKKE